LLYQYQKRILDLVKFIGYEFGFTYETGNSLFSNSWTKHKSNLDLWAWDWLNMYCFEFHFGERKFREQGYRFSIFILSDSGSLVDKPIKSRLEVDEFEEPEKSKTRLVLLMGRNSWNFKPFHEIKSEYLEHEFVSIENENDKNKTVGKIWDLEEFSNEESTRQRLEEFKEFVGKQGFEIFLKPAT
jgi:hypothetical protein